MSESVSRETTTQQSASTAEVSTELKPRDSTELDPQVSTELNSAVSRETRSSNSVEPDLEVSAELNSEVPLKAVTQQSPEPVSRGTSKPSTVDSTYDTPIAREAAQAVHVMNVRKETWPRPAATRIMTVANQKGGVGKTTTTVNIAAALALHGLKVLVIDLDPQGNASTALGISHTVGTSSIYDVLLSGRPMSEVATKVDFVETLWCLPATLDLAGADIELTSQVAREYRLQRALNEFLTASGEGAFDYVLIDCPPSLGLLTLNALVAGKEMLIPIQCEFYALEGLSQLLNTVDLVKSHLNPGLEVTTVLLTMYDSRTRLADEVASEVRSHFGELVLTPVIPRNVRVSEAPGYGQTVITYDAGSRGAIGYLQAAHEIAERGAKA